MSKVVFRRVAGEILQWEYRQGLDPNRAACSQQSFTESACVHPENHGQQQRQPQQNKRPPMERYARRVEEWKSGRNDRLFHSSTLPFWSYPAFLHRRYKTIAMAGHCLNVLVFVGALSKRP